MRECCSSCEEFKEVQRFPTCMYPAIMDDLCKSCAESEGFEWDGNY